MVSMVKQKCSKMKNHWLLVVVVVDVAIAAPLEVGQHKDGRDYIGKIYIFRGNSITSISTSHSQVGPILGRHGKVVSLFCYSINNCHY